VSTLAVSGTNLFAGTGGFAEANGGGVFLSTDDGVNWTAVNTGLTNLCVRVLAVSGTNLFAGTNGGGVFRSTDNGASWSPANSGLPDTNCYVSTFCCSDTMIFCGVVGATGVVGPFCSTDNGTSWTQITSNPNLTWHGGTGLLFMNGIDLFADNSTGIYRSTDYGASWTPIDSDLTELAVNCFMVSGPYLFAASEVGGAYRSSDNGTSWTQVDSGMSLYVSCVAVNGANLYAGTAGGGVFLSTNNGETWTESSASLDIGYVNALAATDTTIFASNGGSNGANNGSTGPPGCIWLSTDNGKSWTEVNSNITNTNVWGLAISGTNIFAGTQGAGVFCSTNNGASWTPVNSGLTSDTVWALVSNDTCVYAGTANGLFLSADKGASWTQINKGQRFTCICALAVSGNSLFACTNVGTYVSTDNGTSWTAAPNLSKQDVNGIAATNKTLFAATALGVWKYQLSPTPVVDRPNNLPVHYSLQQNYPNPFNPSTTIGYQLPTNAFVVLKLYDVLGREVETLVNERETAGNRSVRFSASNLPSGVYFYRLEAGTYHDTKKLVLLK